MDSHITTAYFSTDVGQDMDFSFYIFKMCGAERDHSKNVDVWYRTPKLIHRQGTSCSDRCWSCGLELDSLFDIFWLYPEIQPFWTEVMMLIQTVIGLSLPLDPVHYLLCLPFSGVAKSVKWLISYLLLAVKSTPIWFWFLQLIAEIWRMEYLTDIVHDVIPQSNKMW